jgi:hypothetical protein
VVRVCFDTKTGHFAETILFRRANSVSVVITAIFQSNTVCVDDWIVELLHVCTPKAPWQLDRARRGFCSLGNVGVVARGALLGDTGWIFIVARLGGRVGWLFDSRR